MAMKLIICTFLLAMQADLLTGAFPYVYFPSAKGRLCFQAGSYGSSMKMTATSCCYPSSRIEFQDNNIFIGKNLCFGGDVKDGSTLKVFYQSETCASFNIGADGYLKVRDSSGMMFCMKEFEHGPKIRNCDGSLANYNFYNNGTCHDSKAASTKIAHLKRLVTVDNFVLTNDGSKLTLTESTKSDTATTLLWYSNKELYAHVGGEEKCLYVDEQDKLSDLDGKDVKYDKDNIKGCMGQTFQYRSDIKTFELSGTNYCWRNEGSALKLRLCSSVVVFSTMSAQWNTGTTSVLQLKSSSIETSMTSSLKSNMMSSMTSNVMSSITLRVTSSVISSAMSSVASQKLSFTLSPELSSKYSSVFSPISSKLSTRPTSSMFFKTSTSSPVHTLSLNSVSSHSLSTWLPLSRMQSVLSSTKQSNSGLVPGSSTTKLVNLKPSDISEGTSIGYTVSNRGSTLSTQILDSSSVNILPLPAGSKSYKTTSFLIQPTKSSGISASTSSAKPQVEKIYHNLYLANPGQQCEEFCRSNKMYCSSQIDTGNTNDGFLSNGVSCSSDGARKQWTNTFDPFYNTSNGACYGYLFVNRTVPCYIENLADRNVRRLCRCVKNADEDHFSPWMPWSKCTALCNIGKQERQRICNEFPCNAESLETRECNNQPCPVNGGFSDWSVWSGCSKSCGGGNRNRTRSCSNPVPEYGGLDCFGDKLQIAVCNVGYCPVDGTWTKWTEWSACDKPCNGGWYRRWRYCTNPAPLYGGQSCDGDSQERVPCNPHTCPAENITAVNVRFDKVWKKELGITGSREYQEFYNLLKTNLLSLYQDESFNRSYLDCSINTLSNGSIVATFTLYFTGLDSFQMLLLQDAVKEDKYIGKLKILSSNDSLTSTLVPSASPINFTLSAPEPNMVMAKWERVATNHRNGNITGYILFYKEKLLRAEHYQSIATTNLTVTLRGLLSYTEYMFRVLAYNENGNGLASDAMTIFTQDSVPSTPPQNVQAIANSPFTAIVNWENLEQNQWNGNPVGTLIIYVDLKGQKANQTVPFPESFAKIGDLHPMTAYLIDVCAVTRKGAGPCRRVQATTLATPPTRSPSNIMIASLMSHNSIQVSWQRLSSEYVYGDLKGYKVIYRLVKLGGNVIASSKKETKIIHPSLTQATLSELQPNAQYTFNVLAFNQHGDGKMSETFTGDTCPCPEVIYTNFAASSPYMFRDKNGEIKGLIASILKNMTSSVCGTCKRAPMSVLSFKSNGKNGWAEKRSIKEMKMDIDDYVHMSFPIFGNSELDLYNGYAFVPLFSHPGVIYFIIKDTLAEQIRGMILNVLNTWPIFLINMLLIILSGFCIWICDWKSNADEIPHGFFTGIANGFYWSYVTMGTHGYGDITPKGILARLYAVVWILIGIINLGILTGALTTAMTVAQVYDSSMIYNVKVAAVQGSEAYRIGLHRNGRVNEENQYKTIEEVSSALKRREVRGALVDVYSAAMRSDLFNHPDIVAKKRVVYPNAYGLVLTGELKNAASAFRDYLNVNVDKFLEDTRKRAAGLEVNKETGDTVAVFDPESEVFQKTLLGLFAGLVICFLIGALSNFYKSSKTKSFIATETSPSFKLVEDICNSSLLELRRSFKEKLDILEKMQLDERIKRHNLAKPSKYLLSTVNCKERRSSLFAEKETNVESIACTCDENYGHAEVDKPNART
ncbi:uncharacterized protein LOC135688582 isoform X2 [Rhopilema esculentum]|uniref:uncharacterized protein LOC135688582 isoform X2 n=1 Tax=Rhopilema esculentum TaxID=499914 RepID=UPI0031D3F8EA